MLTDPMSAAAERMLLVIAPKGCAQGWSAATIPEQPTTALVALCERHVAQHATQALLQYHMVLEGALQVEGYIDIDMGKAGGHWNVWRHHSSSSCERNTSTLLAYWN